ncbi:ATP-dependent nuclease [Alkalihalobacterium sp. APHAB7]|uniref:ATP-dependent nuclease n=1 Tax=Alkalihalobacterium sp. APHAB7 TaxID=3402081 RepID=UPI003AB0AF1B
MRLGFFLKRGDNRICAYLTQLGTGVSQLFMLLSFLYLNRNKSLNIFIEEPEGNLHPDALIQLLKIIEDRFSNHRFFISTHSSSLIDQVNDNWSIHQVYRSGNSPSIMVPCQNIIQKYALLDDLGIRASQILQTNLVIWVEGPSDRIYIKKWIEDLTPNSLHFIEGKHYSFLMYGGANLTSYDILGDEKIDMLSTSRYAVVVCDSDKAQEDASLKSRVVNIVESIERINLERKELGIFSESSLLAWVTKGREIENYVPHALFKQVIFSEKFIRKYVYVDIDGKREKKNIIQVDSPEREFNQYDSFDEYFSSLYRFESGEQLEAKYLNRIASDLSKNKNAIAKEVTLSWDWDHPNDELKEKVEEIVKLIIKANGF